MFQINGDLEDLETALKQQPHNHVLGSGSCSALIKLLPANADLYVAQDTWSTYQSMLRIIKRYDFSYHMLSGLLFSLSNDLLTFMVTSSSLWWPPHLSGEAVEYIFVFQLLFRMEHHKLVSIDTPPYNELGLMWEAHIHNQSQQWPTFEPRFSLLLAKHSTTEPSRYQIIRLAQRWRAGTKWWSISNFFPTSSTKCKQWRNS